MKKQITPPGSALPMGAYSHIVTYDIGAHTFVYLTGQIALDASGNVVSPNDIEAQSDFVFAAVRNLLHSVNCSMDDIVKVQIFLTNINDFPKVGKVRDNYLKISRPVSTLVEVSSLVKPGCCIELDATAIHFNGV